MKYTIFYPTPLTDIADITNDNIDVCITTELGHNYTFVIATVRNLSCCFLEKSHYVTPVPPMLIVESLTKEAVEGAVAAVMSEDEKIIALYGGDLG